MRSISTQGDAGTEIESCERYLVTNVAGPIGIVLAEQGCDFGLASRQESVDSLSELACTTPTPIATRTGEGAG
jgi:hypothetical protein